MTRRAAIVLLGGVQVVRFPGLLSAAKARELCVLLVDERTVEGERLLARRAAGPGHPLAAIDGAAWAGPSETMEIVEQLLAWARQREVLGVCALREEYVETAGVAADLLGLPSPGLRASSVCVDRCLQRLYLEEWSPAFQVVPPELRERAAEDQPAYPVVVKPARRRPGPGAQLALDRASLVSLLARYGSGETLLFETWVGGRECSVDTLVQDGAVVLASIGREPDLAGASRARLLDVNRRALNRLGFRAGFARAEYRLTERGDVLLMEIVARPVQPLARGALTEAALLQVLLGEPVRGAEPCPRAAAESR